MPGRQMVGVCINAMAWHREARDAIKEFKESKGTTAVCAAGGRAVFFGGGSPAAVLLQTFLLLSNIPACDAPPWLPLPMKVRPFWPSLSCASVNSR